MINSTEVKYRNNVPFNAQSVPLSQNGQQITVPAMQGIQDSYVSNRVKKAEYGWASVPIGVGMWLGICKGMDYFNNKLCSKEYMETPFGKLGAWGDRVSDGYFNSSFAKSEAGQSFHSFLRRTKNYINEKIIGKNKVLTAIKTTPTSPEHSMVVAQAKGLLGLHNMEIQDLLPSFIEKSEVADQLERYGMKKDEIAAVKKALKGKKKAERLRLLEQEEFKLFGVKDADALKAAKIRALGFKDVAHYESIAKGNKFLQHSKEVFEALKNADPNMHITRCQGEGKFGWFRKLFFRRNITFKELANKYIVAGIDNPHKTKLGRGLSKGFGWFLEGMTNRFAGGKFVAIMQAMFLAEAAVATLNATGASDKVKTFIERNVNAFSYVFAAPLAIMAMHRVGGMKYAGMTPEQVAKFREELAIFNEKVDAGAFKNKEAYKAAKQKLTDMLQGDTKNGFFTKMCKKIGQFINIGNEKIKPYKSLDSNNMNFFRKLGYWTKNAAGYPLRFGLAMFVLMPFVANATTKISNFIFGKPKNSVLDEDKEDETAKAENVNAQLARLRQDALQRQQAVAAHNQTVKANANAPRMDMLTKYRQHQNANNVVNNTTNIYNNQPQKQEEAKEPEPVRTYIPSPVGVQTVIPNVDPANQALQRSMEAEQEALKILAMK